MAKTNYLKYLEEADQERARAIFEKVKDAPASDWTLMLKVNVAQPHLRRMTLLAFKELERFGKNMKFYTGQGAEAKNCLPLSATISGMNTHTGHPDTPIGELITVALSLKASTIAGFAPEELNDGEWIVSLWVRSVAKTLNMNLDSDLLLALRKLFKACRLHAKNFEQGLSDGPIMEESRNFLRDGVDILIKSAENVRSEIERQETIARTFFAK
ncbi:MAG: hypothetical protein MJ240_13890 [Kiritimatiellae bacterium]|nr:hypothetical protein [Kiritimatiellia bacterium]